MSFTDLPLADVGPHTGQGGSLPSPQFEGAPAREEPGGGAHFRGWGRYCLQGAVRGRFQGWRQWIVYCLEGAVRGRFRGWGCYVLAWEIRNMSNEGRVGNGLVHNSSAWIYCKKKKRKIKGKYYSFTFILSKKIYIQFNNSWIKYFLSI